MTAERIDKEISAAIALENSKSRAELRLGDPPYRVANRIVKHAIGYATPSVVARVLNLLPHCHVCEGTGDGCSACSGTGVV